MSYIFDLIINNFGWPLVIVYLFYMMLGLTCFYAVRDVCRDFESYRKNKKDVGELFTSFERVYKQLAEAVTTKRDLLIENRIEQLWIEYERKIQAPVVAINSYSNSLILWGFVGTLYGAAKAFVAMSDMLRNDIPLHEAFMLLFEGKLNVALYSSMIAAFIAAMAATIVTAYLGGKLMKNFEFNMNDEIYNILNSDIQKNKKDKAANET